MKWVVLTYFIFLFSSATSRDLSRFAQEAEYKNEIAHHFNNLKEEHFKAVTIITFAQYLQKCSYESISELVKNVVDLAQSCVANKDALACTKSLQAIFLDEICQIKKLHDSYGAMADCCANADPERNECFLSFKTTYPPFLIPYQRPEPDAVCKELKENRQSFLGHYVYGVARRLPFLFAPTILALGDDYELAVETCCPVTDIGVCLEGKIAALKEKATEMSLWHEHSCGIWKMFGEKTFQAQKLALLSQRFPKAPFEEVYRVANNLKGVYKECCDGNMMDCMHNKAQVVEYVCSKQNVFSSKIKKCCEKAAIDKGQCVVEAGRDEKPEDLPLIAGKYVQDPDVCNHFVAGHDKFLAEFIYEYSRRHQEFSTEMLLRIAKGYEEVLEKCCKNENPSECYGKVEEKLQSHIQETEATVKTNCDLLKNGGEFEFQKAVLIRFTKKMPQVSTETLLEITKKMAAVGVKCCQKSEDSRLLCVERYLSIVIQDMCKKQEATLINDQVAHCCNESYANRRPCFTKLGVDENYVLPPFNPDMFNFDETLCTAPPQIWQENHLGMLINLIKHKPKMTDEELQTIVTGFSGMVDKCCKAADHDTCFGKEGANLIIKSRATLKSESKA
ncbi:albumin isoform X2 [Alligator mississippiensis]|uniref:albumin isoform X2 n=1 Tax=Alligator mississippiensis TaxID=8496 RepID=UPI0003D0B84A|nr:albumin isoform X2 [Alligator mississippiensis]